MSKQLGTIVSHAVQFGLGFASSLAGGAGPKGALLSAAEGEAASVGELCGQKFIKAIFKGEGDSILTMTLAAKGDDDDWEQITNWSQVDAWVAPNEINMMDDGLMDEFAGCGIADTIIQGDNALRQGPAPLVVYAHGTTQAMWVPTKDGKHGFINAHMLAEIILNDTHWKPGQPIVLLSCLTGKDEALVVQYPEPGVTMSTGGPSLAHQLADELHAKVTAPDHKTNLADFMTRGRKNSGWITYDGTK
jgi:hypothetical protein